MSGEGAGAAVSGGGGELSGRGYGARGAPAGTGGFPQPTRTRTTAPLNHVAPDNKMHSDDEDAVKRSEQN